MHLEVSRFVPPYYESIRTVKDVYLLFFQASSAVCNVTNTALEISYSFCLLSFLTYA
jgi:hypothetical protein